MRQGANLRSTFPWKICYNRKNGGSVICNIAAYGVVPLFDKADWVRKAMLVHDILYILDREERLNIEWVSRPGLSEELTAPEFRLSLLKNGKAY